MNINEIRESAERYSSFERGDTPTHDRHAYDRRPGYRYDDADRLAEAFLAHPYGVLKPLEWVKRPHSENTDASTAFGDYLACPDMWFAPGDGDGRESTSMEDSVRCCQQHYESAVAALFTKIGERE